MKHISLYILFTLLTLLSFNHAANAFEVTTINGSAQFKCKLLSKYMEKHGYFYIKEIIYEKTFKTNIFAAKDAEVIIKSKYDTVLAIGKADKKGNFSISVPKDNNYKIVVRFHDREIEEVVSYSDAINFIADFGYFDTEKVGNWIQIPTLSYCYTCNIRYLETKGSL